MSPTCCQNFRLSLDPMVSVSDASEKGGSDELSDGGNAWSRVPHPPLFIVRKKRPSRSHSVTALGLEADRRFFTSLVCGRFSQQRPTDQSQQHLHFFSTAHSDIAFSLPTSCGIFSWKVTIQLLLNTQCSFPKECKCDLHSWMQAILSRPAVSFFLVRLASDRAPLVPLL